MPLVKRKKKKIPARRRTGIGAAPFDKGIDAVHSYFHYEIDRKDLISALKSYAKANTSKEDFKFVSACPEYKFWALSYHCATAAYVTHTNDMNDRVQYWKDALDKYVLKLVETGKPLYFEKQAKAKDSANVVTLSPQQRLQKKISNTIMQDLLALEDAWMDGDKAELDIYQEFKRHSLSGSAVKPVREVIEGWLLDYEDAYHKRCNDAVEGYAHLKRPELNRRIKACQSMLNDCDRIRSAAKATRATRVKQPKSADKQIARVQYKKEDTEYKLVSIPPIKVVGGTRLFTFNTKTRVISEYITQDTKGFEISGTTIKNFDKVNSRCRNLRKPAEFFPEIFDRSPKQIDKAIIKHATELLVKALTAHVIARAPAP